MKLALYALVLALVNIGVASADALRESMESASAKLPVEARQALAQIEGTPRQLLALRGYLRAQATLESRWSWTQAQIAEFERSAQYRNMLAAVDRVARHFEQHNPGYTLYANTQVRSLDLQLKRWNENRTVGKLADELYAAASNARARDFEQWLSAWQPSAAVPLATPGLSLHGQLKAIDFQVHASGRVVAGPDTSTIARVWEGQGWARKVADSVAAAGKEFKGPLRMPNEPWHFEYSAADAVSASQSVPGPSIRKRSES